MKKKLPHLICSLVLPSFIYGDISSTTPASKLKESPSYFVDASFIYWYAKEDGLNIAESAVVSTAGHTFLSADGKVLQQSFSYNPGFKVGGGLKQDNWNLLTEYTWLRGNNKTSKHAPKNHSATSGVGAWNIDDWFLQTTTFGQSPTGSHISSKWHLGLDIVDLLAGASIYENKAVKASAAVGLRTTWIRQKMDISLTQTLASVVNPFLPDQPIKSHTRSRSWGIGPKMGLDLQYLLPVGFRFEGSLATSLLYTQFSSIKHHENAESTLALNKKGISTKLGNYSSVRPVLEMKLGTGWHIDFSENKYAFDLKASYDFSIFWGQNVMRKMLDEFWAGTDASAGDLYLQGLTLSACFKF